MIEPFVLSNGDAYSASGRTGTMAASLAANSIVWAIRAAPDTAGANQSLRRGPLVIDGMRLTFTCLVASATPFAATRALALYRGTDATQLLPTGGSAITSAPKRTLASGADDGTVGIVIAGTAALTVTGFTRSNAQLANFDLAGAGAAGTRLERHWRWALEAGHIQLDPGETLTISNPAALDALMTWQLTVELDYHRRDSI